MPTTRSSLNHFLMNKRRKPTKKSVPWAKTSWSVLYVLRRIQLVRLAVDTVILDYWTTLHPLSPPSMIHSPPSLTVLPKTRKHYSGWVVCDDEEDDFIELTPA
ncbi:hypothetical protein Acr_00g0018450 [Actinidia rufa]|uniref:Uncharacterized protein n=1 Tax=Actinidia rufa TaxID=165716 RepID=A0A7J0DDA9_9ERIC|nr:hypothetical protein Acr_00g0018450 [Actinidia rufa]